MKNIILLGLILTSTACTSPQRAGENYDPDIYNSFKKIKNTRAEFNGSSVPMYSYHSALGNFCTQYQSNDKLYMRCDNGENQETVPVL